MSGIEDIDGMDAVYAALEAAHDWQCARRRVARLFEEYDPPRLVHSHGLERRYSGLAFRELHPDLPFGWTSRHVVGRDAYIIMPCWLAWARDLREARWGVFRLAMRLGLWRIPVEGDYYVNGRLSVPRWLARAWATVQRVTWCFLNDRDEYPRLDILVSGPTWRRWRDSLDCHTHPRGFTAPIWLGMDWAHGPSWSSVVEIPRDDS